MYSIEIALLWLLFFRVSNANELVDYLPQVEDEFKYGENCECLEDDDEPRLALVEWESRLWLKNPFSADFLDKQISHEFILFSFFCLDGITFQFVAEYGQGGGSRFRCGNYRKIHHHLRQCIPPNPLHYADVRGKVEKLNFPGANYSAFTDNCHDRSVLVYKEFCSFDTSDTPCDSFVQWLKGDCNYAHWWENLLKQ